MSETPGLNWWMEAAISKHERRLIRLGYFERMADEQRLAAQWWMSCGEATATATVIWLPFNESSGT